MTVSAQKTIVIVNHSAMMNDTLYRAMHYARKDKIAAMTVAIKTVVAERKAFESTVERRVADGSFVTGQSADIKHVEALATSTAFARLCVALKLDPRAYIYPQSQEGGKLSTETSSLKAYKKAREIAETIWNGSSTLENVVKVFSVCAIKLATVGQETMTRRYLEDFFASREYRSISQGSSEFLLAVEECDEMRARHMSGGKATQASQMVRTLVALKSAVDVRNGRMKDTKVDPRGLVSQALMRRFGQVNDVVEHSDAVMVD